MENEISINMEISMLNQPPNIKLLNRHLDQLIMLIFGPNINIEIGWSTLVLQCGKDKVKMK